MNDPIEKMPGRRRWFDRPTALLEQEWRRRQSNLRLLGESTFRPGRFVDRLAASTTTDLQKAFGYFLFSVGVVIAIEAAFSFVFNTAFSDLLHHAFPIIIALFGGLVVYVFLKVLWTRSATFKPTIESSLYVGGTAIVVMLTLVFMLLTIDFASNYDSEMASSCKHRTIMCLLSGNRQSEYGLMQDVGSPETQGGSFPLILFVLLGSAFYFTHYLVRVFKARMAISGWRTWLAAVAAMVVLTPASLMMVNAVYQVVYPR